MQGWISLYKKVKEHWLYPIQQDRKFTEWEAWEYLLLSAFYEPYKKQVQKKLITIPIGGLVIASSQLADVWKWNRRTVDNFLKTLEQDGMITRQKINPKNPKTCTLLKVNNYADYQGKNEEKCTSEYTLECTSECTPNNNIINNKIGKKQNKSFKVPLVEEIKDYCNERQNGIDASKFFDFYEARGWKTGKNSIKDWKACVRTWENNQKSDNSKPVLKADRECTEHEKKCLERGLPFDAVIYE